MEHLQGVVPAAVAEMLREMPFSTGKLQFAWKVAVGAAIERVTVIDLDERATLRVTVSGPLWRREVERSLPVIRERLAILLGDQTVKGIEIRSS
jgi:hypothetical protein